MFKPAPLFSDHAVVPCSKELRIFGEADCGETIHALLTDADGNVTGEGWCTGRDGRFMLCLPPQRPGMTLRLTLSSDAMTWTAQDVRPGLLFMAGGQSNMEWTLQNADEGKTLLSTHHAPLVRYFPIPRVAVLDENALTAHASARWQAIEPHQCADMSAVAYFFAMKVHQETGLPVGIIGCNWGGTSILAWMDEEALQRTTAGAAAKADYEAQTAGVTMAQWQAAEDAFEAEVNVWNDCVARIKAEHPGIEWTQIVEQAGECPWHPPMGPGSPYRAGALAKTMVDFVAPAALSGVLFYQGESDVERAEIYGDLLITLVTRWRELFHDPELPFYNVQLPMFIDAHTEDDHSWAVLRHQQEKAWHALRESYLAVMIDGGEWNNIHPTDKRTPGERLAALFMERFSHQASTQRWAKSKSTQGNVLTVELTGPVQAQGGEADLFEIAGDDGVFYPARAELDGNLIHLTADEVPHPVAARYAWVNYAKVHVFGGNQPLAPFWME